jgi:hypothetical protein
MTGDPMRALDPVVRALSREIMQAPDWQINRIVALVDAMLVRGDADHLLAPLRHRLALLKPPRPLRLARLIFHPLKPLIIPASSWRPGQHAVPRTVILPMAGQVRLAMGAAGIAIETSMAGQTTAVGSGRRPRKSSPSRPPRKIGQTPRSPRQPTDR